MEILRNYKQISDKINEIFNIDVSNIPMLDAMSFSNIRDLLKNAQVSANCENAVSKLAELIFQLNEYLPALCNLTKMFLHTKNYWAIILFLEKLFVAHVGPSTYISKNKEYSHKERYFDRFIEVVKSTDITTGDVLPFLFAIVEDNDKSSISVWLAPALEYLQNLYRENMEEIASFVATNSMHNLTYLELGLEFNTQKAISQIFDSEIGAIDDKLIAKMLKHYYTDTMAFFDKNLETAGNKKFNYVKILASIENPEVTARLEDLYEEEQNEEIKNFIKLKLGISSKQNLGVSPKHFETMAQKKVETIQERTLGIAFEKVNLNFVDGTPANNIVKTYLINIFKEEKDLLNLCGLSDVKTLFNEIDLNNFAEKLYFVVSHMKDIKEAKWAIRLISLLASEQLLEQIYEFIAGLYKLNRHKEAKYFMECLIYAKRAGVITTISKLIEEQNPKFLEDKDYFVSIYSENLQKTNSDVLDMLASDEITEEAIASQKQRLYAGFIANKSYSKQQFEEIFIEKKVFNILAQKLVFGEYKQDRLLSLFVLEEKQIKYIAGTAQDANDLKIKIAHSLDLDDRFESAKSYFSNPTFKQFTNSIFPIKENEKTLSKVSSMHGILINAIKFISEMAEFGFIKNISHDGEDATELVHACPELNLLAEVAFETPVTYYTSTSSLGNIRFYKLNQCLKNGSAYIINKANAIAIGGVEPRYYDYVLNAVSASKKL